MDWTYYFAPALFGFCVSLLSDAHYVVKGIAVGGMWIALSLAFGN